MTAVDLAVTDGIAHLCLRGVSGNPIDATFVADLEAAVTACRSDAAVRVVVVTGDGANFCAGGDLRFFAEAGEQLGDAVADLAANLHRCLESMSTLDVPVIAAVQGSVAGAGLSFTAACDLVVAARSAKFVLAYSRVGLSPDGGASWALPRLVGLRRALELALLNRMLSADEALEWGLITMVVDDDALENEALALAQQLAAGPT
ncbi:MAG: enoyl-CoA hydratase, partial [Acidimicrobiia bacterium]|nr:enoyl-CoA hydratase [Acidimicrobiia bacterium]